MAKRILVAGGAGFIGSNLIRLIIQRTEHQVLNVDKLTYAGNLESLNDVEADERYRFVQLDIADTIEIQTAMESFQPDWVINLAAESHVDRSIDGPRECIQTNVMGTFTLLESTRKYWSDLASEYKVNFRYLQVSTDEVFGCLSKNEPAFSEANRYEPHSPYSASKAAADHLVRAWFETYGLPILISNCSNNYGPYQYPEKLIPLVILKAIHGEKIPIYGDGENIRDWIYVDDHAYALIAVLSNGVAGETYNVGARCECSNNELVEKLCRILDHELPVSRNAHFSGVAKSSIHSYSDLIEYVDDRPGHDFRYAIDSTKIETDLNWRATEKFEIGLTRTVQWYLANSAWWSNDLQRSISRQGVME